MSNYYCSHGNTIAIIATIGEQGVPPHIIMEVYMQQITMPNF